MTAPRNLVIRPFVDSDELDAFAAWSEAVADGGSFPREPPGRLVDFRSVWIQNAAITQIALRDGVFAGVYFVAPNFTGPCAHIAKAGYVVPKPFRREGIGRALVSHSLAVARESGFDAMMFNLVMESNPSRTLYESLGFVQIGRIPDAVGDVGALIFWRRL